MSRAVLSLGSNLGNRLGYLDSVVEKFCQVMVAASGVYETRPWGFQEQGDFLNAVCIVDDPACDQWDWLAAARDLEMAAHRVRTRRWGPRTLDVDLIAVDDLRQDDPKLTLPHPEAASRAFVLIPWLEIEPPAELPDYGPIRTLCDALPACDRETVLRRSDLSLKTC